MSLSNNISYPDLFEQISARSLAASFVFNLQTRRFEYLNEAFFEIWPLDPERIDDQLLSLVASVVEEDRDLVHQSYQKLLSSSFRQSAEFRIRFKKGPERWICATAYVITRDGQREAIAGFAEDITHYKPSAMENKYSIHKNTMLEMLAHDLGGPLGIVQKLALQLEERSRQVGQEALATQASLIHQTVRESIQLIHDLLEQEYLESSNTAFTFGRVELIEQLQALLAGFQRMNQDAHKHFEIQSASPQVFVQIDQTKFLQMINNLVSNANKFTPEGGHITINVQEEVGRVRISVSDDGIGIPEHLQPGLFERFTKARRPGLKGEETVGLGLSIVKRIVELHQGKVWVESKENEGTTFFVEIPSQQPSPQ